MVNNKPTMKVKAGHIVATVWDNIRKKGDTPFSVKTIKIVRVYKDDQGNPREASTFSINDLPRVILVAVKAYEKLVSNGNGNGNHTE